MSGAAPRIGVVVFRMGGVSYGLFASDVQEILPAATIVPLPEAPPFVEGIVDVRGKLVPVLDLRARLRLAPRSLAPSDHLILVQTRGRVVALRADRAEALAEIAPSSIEAVDHAVPGVGLVAGVARLPDGMLLIHDPTRFLSEAEALSLEEALSARAGSAGAKALAGG
jgi:purine-binding chemotaxis protein CheW